MRANRIELAGWTPKTGGGAAGEPSWQHQARKRLLPSGRYKLWEQNGQPEGREEEFWRLAEQELLNEDKSSPLRTPDNL